MANMIPAASAEFETAGSTGNFVAWFDCTLAQSTARALAGTGSMEVTSTGTSVGVQQDNWPGWAITGGQDVGISASCWKANPARTVSVEYDWRNEGGTSQQTDTLTLSVGGSAWVTESATVAVPATATRLFVTITWGGNSSDVAYFDSIEADDAPGGGATEVAPGSATHSHTAGQPSLTQTHELAAANVAHSHAAEQPALTQANALTVDGAVHGHTATQPTITQVHVITPADALHAHAADQPAVVEPADVLVDLELIALAPVLGHGAVTVGMVERTAAAPAMVDRAALAPAMVNRAVGTPALGHGDTDVQFGHGSTDHALGHGQPGEPTL